MAKKPEVNIERGIVRILETTVDGHLKLRNGLRKIKGVGHSLAKAIVTVSGLDGEMYIGNLSDEQIEKIEDIIRNPTKYGIPSFMVNRRRDPETGEDLHISESELTIKLREDVEKLRKMRAYRGIRHELGLPVRGQRTRSSFRRGRTVGVQRKKK